MTTTLAEFEDGTAFERLALAEGFPLLAKPDAATLDLRGAAAGARIAMTMSASLGAGARQELIDRLRPLFFGAAWKILDLLLEFAFHTDGLRPRTSGRWTIAEKQRYASQYRGRSSPWIARTDLWERICDIYLATVEARHSLVHRRFSISVTGDMTDIRDRNGVRKPDITSAEQEVLAKAVQRVAAATLTSALSNRERSAIARLFDQLAAHHGRPPLGGHEACPIEVVLVDAIRTSSGWVVNVDRASAEVHRVFANRPFYDIEIHFPGTGLPPITGSLEEVPAGSAVPIDPHAPPSWARQ